VFAAGGDGRSAWARRWNDLIFAHASDLGGPEALSEAQTSICRRVGVLVLADLRAEDVSELGQLLTSGLPGNLLGDRLGRVQSGRVTAVSQASTVSFNLQLMMAFMPHRVFRVDRAKEAASLLLRNSDDNSYRLCGPNPLLPHDDHHVYFLPWG
jgi:hypothetical protein